MHNGLKVIFVTMFPNISNCLTQLFLLKCFSPQELLKSDNAAEIFNVLSTLPAGLTDVEDFLMLWVLQAEEGGSSSSTLDASSVTDIIIEDNRRRHVSFLLSQQGK